MGLKVLIVVGLVAGVLNVATAIAESNWYAAMGWGAAVCFAVGSAAREWEGRNAG